MYMSVLLKISSITRYNGFICFFRLFLEIVIFIINLKYRTLCYPIRSVIITRVMLCARLILSLVITLDQIGLHSVLLPLLIYEHSLKTGSMRGAISHTQKNIADVASACAAHIPLTNCPFWPAEKN